MIAWQVMGKEQEKTEVIVGRKDWRGKRMEKYVPEPELAPKPIIEGHSTDGLARFFAIVSFLGMIGLGTAYCDERIQRIDYQERLTQYEQHDRADINTLWQSEFRRK